MAAKIGKSSGYQILLVSLLSLNFGIVFFDRNALNFLMPFVQPELGLSNTQVGTVASVFSFIWAIAALSVSRISDMVGNRKVLLVIATLAFSCCSFLTGLASTFAMLVGARIVMGVAEGGIMPISHAIITSDVEHRFRGLAQGVAQGAGSNFLGSFVAPVVLVWLAQDYGWRNAFYLAGVPGILSAGLIWFLIDEPAKPAETDAPAARARKSPARAMTDWFAAVTEALKIRNIWICVVVGILLVAYLVITWAFMPLFLTQARGYSQSEASWLMATLGISATICSFVIPGLSDIIGRRPIMISMPLISLLLPLGALYYHGPYLGMVAIFFFGWALIGAFTAFMATVPSESVPPAMMATVFGLCMGVCEIVGGAGGPLIAGIVADKVGLQGPMWILAGLTLAGGLISFGITETAPRVVARRRGENVPAEHI